MACLPYRSLRYNRAMKKSKASSSPKRKPSRRSSNNGRRRWFWRFMFRLCAIGLVLLAGWMVYLDAVVTSRFEGRRFEVPSRVYARPLELFDGASVSASALERELSLSGFRKGGGEKAGSYQRSGNRFVISTRTVMSPGAGSLCRFRAIGFRVFRSFRVKAPRSSGWSQRRSAVFIQPIRKIGYWFSWTRCRRCSQPH